MLTKEKSLILGIYHSIVFEQQGLQPSPFYIVSSLVFFFFLLLFSAMVWCRGYLSAVKSRVPNTREVVTSWCRQHERSNPSGETMIFFLAI